MSQSRRHCLKFLLLSLVVALGLPFHSFGVKSGKVHKCSICRMKIDERTHFVGRKDGKKDGEPVHFCSFICAHQYRKKYKTGGLQVRDFVNAGKSDSTPQFVDADQAFYLVKSKKISDELGFGMPPMVVGFDKKTGADTVHKRLKDGNVVKGFQDVQKTYQ